MSFPRIRRQPLVGLALAAITGILLAEFWRLPLVFLCPSLLLLAAVTFLWPRIFLAHLLVAASFFALHLWQQDEAPGRKLRALVGNTPRTAEVVGTITAEPIFAANGYATFLLRLKSIRFDGRDRSCEATIRARWKGEPRLGDQVQLRGMIEPIPPARNPGAFDLRAYLARRDVYQSLFARYPENGKILETGGGNWLIRRAAEAREWMRQTLSRGLDDSPEVVALISGMALGLRHQTPNDIEEPFQQTGTLHLFAVAGLHVGIIAQLLWIVTGLLRLPRKLAAATIIPCLFFYSAITGFHVSSVRAATMAALLLGGIFFHRPVLALNSLAGAALLILAVDPNQLLTSGFQLSFAVVGAILLWQSHFFQLLLQPAEPDPFLPPSLVGSGHRAFASGYRWLAGGVSVSAAAWVGSVVLILWYFYLITPISLLATLTVVPAAFCVLAIGLLSLLAAPLSLGLSVVFNNANWSLCQLILGLVQLFSHLPAGHLYAERPHLPTSAIAEMTVLDAGAGGAVHLRSNNEDWLFDAASARDYDRFLRDYLHSRGINRLDGLMLSHGDSLHLGGVAALLEEFRPRRVLDNGAPDRSRVHRDLVAGLPHREVLARGTAIRFGKSVVGEILYPPAGFSARLADDQTLVLRLTIAGKCRVLLVFDSGEQTEEALLARRDDLRSDILIKGQHHSGRSASPAFLDAVRPQLIIASSIDFPARERIPDDWARSVVERGIQLFRQDKTGAVHLEFFENGWRATGFVDQTNFRNSSR